MIACPRCKALGQMDGGACPQCGFAPELIDGFRAWAPAMARAGGGFEAEYFALLAELEDRNFWFRSRNRLLVWALETYFPAMTSFLEVGCGTGYVLRGIAEAFPAARLTGSEIFVDGLQHAAERVPQAEFVQMDARAMPYREAFDVVGAFDVIEHIDDDEGVLSNLYSAVKPGGGLMVTVPQHRWLWSAADDYARHERRYSAKELRKKVEAAGFSVVRSTSFVSLLLPLMALSRIKRQSAEGYDPTAELRLPPAVNRGLETILTLERAMLRAGVDAPAGGSRLIIARRPG